MAWFEEIEIGQVMELGSHTFTSEDIIRFAKKYDPQPFHTDPEAAKDSHFGGLVAAGWHIAAVWMKLMIAARKTAPKEEGAPAPDGRPAPRGGPSPGFFDLKWIKPVRADDVISYRTTTIEKVDLKSRPYQGIIRSLNEGFNQNGELVFSFIGQGLIERREPYKTDTT
jgi:acyl dehydratase